jgi:putative phosphoribosyl transferase
VIAGLSDMLRHGEDLRRDRLGDEALVHVTAGRVTLEGELILPQGARGLVLFSHGSGSSRHSPRNRRVAQALREAGLGTLLLDLLTVDEETLDARTAHLRFDIALLAERLIGVIDWLGREHSEVGVGCFGASTGAAAALLAAAARREAVQAVVSRGGRPDLAGAHLGGVFAPTLLIVGALDTEVIALNRAALAALAAPEKRLSIVPRAGHLFEEAGALDEVSRLATAWFVRHVGSRREPTTGRA